MLGHLAPHAEALEDAHRLRDRLLAPLDDLELALEQATVLREVGALQAGPGLGHRHGHGRALALGGLLVEVLFPRGQRGRLLEDRVHVREQAGLLVPAPLLDERAHARGLLRHHGRRRG